MTRYARDIFLWNKLEQYTVYFVYEKLMRFIACIWNITLVVWKCALKIEAGPWIKWSVVPRSAIALDASRGTRILDYRSSNSNHTTRWRQLTSSLIAWHVEFWSRAWREAMTRTSSRRPWRRFVPETFAKQDRCFARCFARQLHSLYATTSQDVGSKRSRLRFIKTDFS